MTLTIFTTDGKETRIESDMARERSRKRTYEDEIPDWRYGNLCYRHPSMIGIDIGDGESFTPEVE